MASKTQLGPDDNEIKKRAERWTAFFAHYENVDDGEDEGYDFDNLLAITDAEDAENFASDEEDDEYDPENINSDEEALESDREPEELQVEKVLARNVNMSQERRFQELSKLFSPQHILELASIWKTREEELSKLNLPFWNYRKDVNFNENFNQTKDGNITYSRNYQSSTASSSRNCNSFSPYIHDPLQDNRYIHQNLSSSPLSNTSFRLPIEIQQYIKDNSVVNIRVREYDLSICGNNSLLSLTRPNMDLSQAYAQKPFNNGLNQQLALTNSSNNQMEPYVSLFKLPPPPPPRQQEKNSFQPSSSKILQKDLKAKLAQDQKLVQNQKSSKNLRETPADSKLKPKSVPQKIQKPPAVEFKYNEASTSTQQSASQSTSKNKPDTSKTSIKHGEAKQQNLKNNRTAVVSQSSIKQACDEQQILKNAKTSVSQKALPNINSENNAHKLSSKSSQQLAIAADSRSTVAPQKSSTSSTMQKTIPVRKSRENLMKRQDKAKMEKYPKHQKNKSLSGCSESKQLCLKSDQNDDKKVILKELTLNDVSTAGSSLSTDSDDLFFMGKAYFEHKRLQHRVKKMKKRNAKSAKRVDGPSLSHTNVKSPQKKRRLKATKLKAKSKPIPKSSEESSSDGEAAFFADVERAAKAAEQKKAEQKKAAEQNKTSTIMKGLIDTDSD